MAKSKKAAVPVVAKAPTGPIGKPPAIRRTKVAIYDGTDSGKMKYLAKYTVYNLDPKTVQEAVRQCLDAMESEWQRANGNAEVAAG